MDALNYLPTMFTEHLRGIDLVYAGVIAVVFGMLTERAVGVFVVPLLDVLPEEQAKRVVSVIGDSTFLHGGITGLVEMVYNPPPTGHVVLILDNSTTAMTGHQEHPGTGRTLEHEPTNKLSFEDLARSLGIENVQVIDPSTDPAGLTRLLQNCLANGQLNVIIARRPCLLIAGKIKEYDRAASQTCTEALAEES